MTPAQIDAEYKRLLEAHGYDHSKIIDHLIDETFQLRAVAIAAVSNADWHYLPADRPDDEVTVLIANDDGDVHEGYFDGGFAYYSHAGTTDRLRMDGAYAWADVPASPPRKQ